MLHLNLRCILTIFIFRVRNSTPMDAHPRFLALLQVKEDIVSRVLPP
jgi:hypothetical protein